MVNEDQAKGTANEIKGKIRETVGKATDNQDLEKKGKSDQLKGKGQKLVGDVKDTADNLKDKVTDAAKNASSDRQS